ncbi:glycosyltransferase family 4 protein [Puniceicoccus vermicola]|uniref:Glycosyltransferase family 4 protein n=1 Tax=Puniceicoccus vermicola TaxID=388746 RepID=A0A7X1E4Z1_9BACT|nr:glycosyltransferase family 4 protein [Puniceicoccus vermicola]MBC2601087.1 glycosyltransferase family 4 protein [Puniceicoccus vermicola]
MSRPTPAIFIYKRTTIRDRALQGSSSDSYTLYGLPELQSEGYPVEVGRFQKPGKFLGWVAACLRRVCVKMTGYCGDFRQSIAGLGKIRRASALVLTSNNSAFPVLFLRWIGFPLPPIFVISVGLEWNPPNESARRLRAISRLFNRADRVLVYSEAERDFLQSRIGLAPDRIVAVPFGIPEKYLPPIPKKNDALSDFADSYRWDFISVGSDAQRDLPMLLDWVKGNPEVRVHLVLGEDLLRELGELPDSVSVESNLTVEEVFLRLRESRAAVIPVRENRYSAGTTFLIHSLACGTPTLVSETSCLGPQYKADKSGCLTYQPGDFQGFSRGMDAFLAMSEEERGERRRKGFEWVRTVANGDPALSEIRNFFESHGIVAESSKE